MKAITEELNLDPKKKEHLYHLLNTVSMAAGPVRATNVYQGSKAVLNEGWTSPKKILSIPYWDKVKVLNRNGYARFDESRAHFFEHNAKLLNEKYDGDARNLLKFTPQELKKEIQCFKGFGPVAADIFIREVRPLLKKEAFYLGSLPWK